MDTTLLKGLTLLEEIIRSDTPKSVSELAEALGLPRSNVHRSLQTLAHADYIEKDPTANRYRPKLKLLGLANTLAARFTVRDLARSELEALSQITGETVVLSSLSEFDMVHLDKIDSKHPIGTFSHIGSHVPAYCTAPGKAMLAYMPEEKLTDLRDRLIAYTPSTITDFSKLKEDLAQARHRGWAVNLGEWRTEINAVGAAIVGPGGQVLGAISVSGPTSRMDTDRRDEIGQLVAAAATRLGAILPGNMRLT